MYDDDHVHASAVSAELRLQSCSLTLAAVDHLLACKVGL